MKNIRLFTLFSLFALGFLSACSTPSTRIQANLDLFNHLPAAQQEMIKKGEVGIGFNAEMVHLALGDPSHVRERTDASGTSEVWVYTSYESPSGGVLYQGWYHRHYSGLYPFYTELPGRREKEQIRITFTEGKVSAIEKEKR